MLTEPQLPRSVEFNRLRVVLGEYISKCRDTQLVVCSRIAKRCPLDPLTTTHASGKLFVALLAPLRLELAVSVEAANVQQLQQASAAVIISASVG
jgi:hypothetical protein